MCTCSLGTRTLPCIAGLHGSHVGWQEQYNFSPLGNEIYFHAKMFLSSCYPTWLTCKTSTLYKSHTGQSHAQSASKGFKHSNQILLWTPGRNSPKSVSISQTQRKEYTRLQVSLFLVILPKFVSLFYTRNPIQTLIWPTLLPGLPVAI